MVERQKRSAPRTKRSARKAAAGARPKQRKGKVPSNIVPITQATGWPVNKRQPLPKGHVAAIILFNGVQIVRSRTQG